MYINANSDKFSGMTLNLVKEGGIGIFWLTVWVTVSLRSEQQLHASTDLELPLNANVIKRNAWQTN